jgi:glycosyltransferase involved in cell wall biosynthesis
MKIAFIIPRLVKKGPVIVVQDLIKNLSDEVEMIHVYHFGEENEIEFYCPTFKINLFSKIDFNMYDIVHSHMLKPDLYIYLHRKNVHNKTKFISTLHQNILDNLTSDYNLFLAYFIEKIWLHILTKLDVVVTLTNAMKLHYLKFNNKLNLTTIYNGRDINVNAIDSSLSEFDYLKSLKKNHKIIGVHCLLTKRKGINQIIKALVCLENYILIVIGNGQELENLKSLSVRLNVNDRCFFLGFKSNVLSYLSLVDIYIMASYSEGFPLALLEAGNLGKPIICSDIEIFRELFSEQDVCFFKLNDVNSLINAVITIENNIDYFSNNVKQLILKKYSCNNMAMNYRDLYLNLLHK